MKYCIYGMANSMIRFSIEQEVITIPFKVLWLHAAKTDRKWKYTICVCKCHTICHYTRYHLWGRLQKFIHLSLTISDIQQDLNPNYPDTRFVFGYAHDKEIYSLEVEGQKPDGIIEYEEYGRTMYMWYYNDLESNKRGDCLSYSVDVPE